MRTDAPAPLLLLPPLPEPLLPPLLDPPLLPLLPPLDPPLLPLVELPLLPPLLDPPLLPLLPPLDPLLLPLPPLLPLDGTPMSDPVFDEVPHIVRTKKVNGKQTSAMLFVMGAGAFGNKRTTRAPTRRATSPVRFTRGRCNLLGTACARCRDPVRSVTLGRNGVSQPVTVDMAPSSIPLGFRRLLEYEGTVH
jgi:hypothetical protein